MKSILRWSIRNSPAMNTIMVAVMVVGAFLLRDMNREVFPEFDLDMILIAVPYPGASPADVEEGVCQKVEEAIRAIDGIKKISATASEGAGSIVLELKSRLPDVQKVLNEVRSEVDRIQTFPEIAEDPQVSLVTMRRPAIRIGVLGPDAGGLDAERALREVAEDVREDLLQLPSVSQASIIGGRDYQIDVEIDEFTLRKYGLSLRRVADLIRRQNLDLPGGTLRADSQEVLVRGKNKRVIGEGIARIPLVTRPDGTILTVGDLGHVRDGFVDQTAITRINGKPGVAITVDKTGEEDLFAIVREVNAFVSSSREPGSQALPEGFQLVTWSDGSVPVRDRMDLLTRNGFQGLILVLLVLATFLELRLAFWVAMGIPMSLLGAGIIMQLTGQTLNMLSMFGFLMALGIVVDDAIVVGENIYTHRSRGDLTDEEAAVEGTYEVLPSVVASVCTTLIAFAPLQMVPGIMGKFIAVMPLVVIAMLVISLLESSFILPCHLAHAGRGSEAGAVERTLKFVRGWPTSARVSFGLLLLGLAAFWELMTYPFRCLAGMFGWLNKRADKGLEIVIESVYVPVLRQALDQPLTMVALGIALLLVAAGVVRSGVVPFISFPKLDADYIIASVEYPDGTPGHVTDEATRRMEESIRKFSESHQKGGKSLIVLTYRSVGSRDSMEPGPGGKSSGSHVGSVSVELVPGTQRDLTSQEIVAQWRELSGTFPGAESVKFGSASMGPNAVPIELQIVGSQKRIARIEHLATEIQARLKSYPGVFDVSQDARPGKWEFQLSVKNDAQALGVDLADLAGTVRSAYYGEEVMRLQRGRHEVKLMVRYPEKDRESLGRFQDLWVRSADGSERPLREVAAVSLERGYSRINRVDQLRSVTISADVLESEGNAHEIILDMKDNFLPELLARPENRGLKIKWEGQQSRDTESITGLVRGLLVALVAMFGLLTLEFGSYLQPILIMLIIPFGTMGAILGHAFMGLPLTLFSLFGLVALTGVVVNDSIVLIDFINSRLRAGDPLLDALVESGRRRFRPVMLTSVTTIAALLPILGEKSFQAQVVIPMATSLAFGLMFTTVLVLTLVPTYYWIYHKIFVESQENGG